MMNSPEVVAISMMILMLISAGAYVAVRLLGAHAVDSDHPHTRWQRH